jgi:cytochrome P450
VEIETRSVGVKSCHFDHHSPEYAAAYPQIYAEMRAAGPVLWSDKYGGFWIATHYEHIRKVLMDPDLFSVELFDDMTKGGIHIPTLERARHRPVFMPGETDGETHDAARAALNPHFSRRRVAQMSGVIDGYVQETFDRVLPLGEFDMIYDLASPIVAGVVSEHLGLELADPASFFRACFEMAAAALNTREGTISTFDEAWDYLGEVVRARRAAPRDDVVSALIGSGSPEFTDHQVKSMTMNVILGAADTASALTAHLVRTIAADAGLGERLRSDPARIPTAVDEGLRFFGVSMGVARTAMRDTTVGSVEIRKGERILLPLPAANLDPSKYDHPDVFDIDRGSAQQVGMGVGSHFCLGAWLAKALVAAVVGELLGRLASYRVIEERTVPNRDKANINSYQSIVIRVLALR